MERERKTFFLANSFLVLFQSAPHEVLIASNFCSSFAPLTGKIFAASSPDSRLILLGYEGTGGDEGRDDSWLKIGRLGVR